MAEAISIDQAWTRITQLWPVVAFLAAMLVLARLCEDEGLFTAAGAAMARPARDGRPRRCSSWSWWGSRSWASW